MQAIIFCGIQATGKTSFYRDHFLKTHVHISLDLFRTHYRENRFLELCLQTSMPFVVDKTNATRAKRARYILAALQNRYRITGYFFTAPLETALERNRQRQGNEVIPEVGIRGTLNDFELPALDEGFDELYKVELTDAGFVLTSF